MPSHGSARVSLAVHVAVALGVTAASCSLKGPKPEAGAPSDRAASAAAVPVDENESDYEFAVRYGVDPDLLLVWEPIPEDENALPLWLEAVRALEPPEGAAERARRAARWCKENPPPDRETRERWQKTYGRPGPPPRKPTSINCRMIARSDPGATISELEKTLDALKSDAASPGDERLRLASAYFARNAAALALVDRGIVRGRARGPKPEFPISETSYAFEAVHLASLRIAKARMHAWLGEPRRAIDEALAAAWMMEMLIRDDAADGMVIVLPSGTLGHSSAVLRWLATRPDVDEATLRDVLARLQPADWADDAWVRAEKIQLLYVAVPQARCSLGSSFPADIADEQRAREWLGDDATDEMVARVVALFGEIEPVRFDVRRFLDAYADGAAKKIEAVRSSWGDARSLMSDPLKTFAAAANQPDAGKAFETTIKRAAAEGRSLTDDEKHGIGKAIDAIGECWYATTSLSPLLYVPFEIRLERQATRALIAARIFELRRGRWPASIGEVVADGIIPDVPVDPFTGKPVEFMEGKRAVRNTGPNGRGRPYSMDW